jgi:hypothetical protein
MVLMLGLWVLLVMFGGGEVSRAEVLRRWKVMQVVLVSAAAVVKIKAVFGWGIW